MGISRIFDLSRRSMATYQRALDITAHNIANASNPEYSRQQVVFSTENPEITGGFVWGAGIKLDSIQRVRNSLTDAQIRTNYQGYHDNKQRTDLLGQVEQLFTEPSELGLSNLMSNFFNSWDQLAVTPNSIPLRSNVVNAAEQVAIKVRSVVEGLDIIRSDILKDAKSKVDSVNNYIRQVQSLNKQIFESEKIGNSAGDLLDRRDTILDELSKLVNLTISYDKDNTASVSIGGVFAADRSNFVEFTLEENGGKLSIESVGGAKVNISGGEMFALTETYSKYIPEYRNKVDSIISSMVEAVNAEHTKGYSIHSPALTGIKFFEDYESGNLKVSQDIIDDPKLIAVSADGTNGNGGIALNIGALISKQILNGTSLSDNYSSLISKIGNDVLKATQIMESSQLVVQQLENQKSSYSGVSIDEEMANVIKFQKSYEASAKLIKVADEMLETLLQMV
ncbi:MAG: flagellar hook-associated protein FlgK [Ignavibacteriaceae bacterium]